jgi:Holliday junction resolvasome RuvABC ATP-dependent DNA helicase subunit
MPNFNEQVGKSFIGQTNIITELSLQAEAIRAGENFNILFEASSGHGKSTLAYLFLNYIDPGFKSTFKYRISKTGINFKPQARFHFIDEVHTLTMPETIYEHLSSERYVFLLATKYYDTLEEPLRNRCLQFVFEEYTKEQLAQIAFIEFLKRNLIDVPPEWCLALAEYCRGTPRIVKELAVRVSIIVRYSSDYSFEGSIHDLMYNILGTEEGGVTTRDRQYLNALDSLGGVASLARIQAVANLPLKVIIEEIEPFLIRKGLLNIDSKGRSLTSYG